MDTFFGPTMWAIHFIAWLVIGVTAGGPGVAPLAGTVAVVAVVLGVAVLRAAARAPQPASAGVAA